MMKNPGKLKRFFQNPIVYIKNLIKEWKRRRNITIVKTSKSPFNSLPGDIIDFSYTSPDKSKSRRTVLVTKTTRAPGGFFLSTRSNILVTCFNININSPSVEVILKTIYKNRIKCDYWTMGKTLMSVLGKNNFRTYNRKFMDTTFELYLSFKDDTLFLGEEEE